MDFYQEKKNLFKPFLWTVVFLLKRRYWRTHVELWVLKPWASLRPFWPLPLQAWTATWTCRRPSRWSAPSARGWCRRRRSTASSTWRSSTTSRRCSGASRRSRWASGRRRSFAVPSRTPTPLLLLLSAEKQDQRTGVHQHQVLAVRPDRWRAGPPDPLHPPPHPHLHRVSGVGTNSRVLGVSSPLTCVWVCQDEGRQLQSLRERGPDAAAEELQMRAARDPGAPPHPGERPSHRLEQAGSVGGQERGDELHRLHFCTHLEDSVTARVFEILREKQFKNDISIPELLKWF